MKSRTRSIGNHSVLIALSLSMLLSACAKPRVVSEIPGTSGIIAVRSRDHKSSRNKADKYMSENCAPNGYKIIEEGEQVSGEVTYAGASGRTIHKDNKKEWQIKYQCTKTAAAPTAEKEKNKKSTK